jgi:hypothetical protein
VATDSGTSVYISSAGMYKARVYTCGPSKGEEELGTCQIGLVNILALKQRSAFRGLHEYVNTLMQRIPNLK